MEHSVSTVDFRGALELFHNGLDTAERELPQVEILAGTAAARLGDCQQATTLGLSVLVGKIEQRVEYYAGSRA